MNDEKRLAEMDKTIERHAKEIETLQFIRAHETALREAVTRAVRDLGTEIEALGGECSINLASIRKGLQLVLGQTCDPETVAAKIVPDAPTDTERLDALEVHSGVGFDGYEGCGVGIAWNGYSEGKTLREHADYIIAEESLSLHDTVDPEKAVMEDGAPWTGPHTPCGGVDYAIGLNTEGR